MQQDPLMRAKRLERFSLLDPANWALRLDLARNYHEAGQHASALEVLDRPSPDAPPGQAAALRGQLLLALGRWQEAQALFQAAAAEEPASAAIAFNLAYAVWADGTQPERAAALFRQALALEPTNLRIRRHLALALEASGEPRGARQVLDQALQQSPSDKECLLQLGRLVLEAGDMDHSAELASRCVAVDPGWAEAWAFKGQVALFALDAASAAKSLRQALDLAPQDTDTQLLLAQASLMQGRPRHAKNALQSLLASEPAHEGALCLLGWACLVEDDLCAAGAAFAKARVAAPEDAGGWAGCAVIALAESRASVARCDAERALALEPGHVLAQLVIQRLHELQCQPQQARAVVASVLAATPFGPIHASTEGLLRSPGVQRTLVRQQRRLAAGAKASAAHSAAAQRPSHQPSRNSPP